MLALLIMIAAGYLAAKTGMMDKHTNDQMSAMIVKLFNPLLTLASAANAVGEISFEQLMSAGGIAVGMFAVFIIVGMIMSPLFEKDRMQRKIYQLMFVFSNVGFIGIPVISSIFGVQYIVYVAEFMLIYNLVFYTYGIVIMDGKFSPASVKAMINPGTIFGLLSMAVVVFEIQLPGFIKTSATYLGNVTSPMALMAVGFALANADIKNIFNKPRLYAFSIFKLLVLPILMLPLMRLVMHDKQLLSVFMVMFGMPVGNMPLILGSQRGLDVTVCSAAIILSTVLCVFTVPILIGL